MPPVGGGEFALENDVDVTEAVSDIKSLDGVPGGLMDAMLACLERSFPTDGICGNGGVAVTGTDD